MTAAPAIHLAGLVHRYGTLEVLRGVDLEIRGPGCFGFLGVNGAGKTTTLRILVGFLEPVAGSVRVLGEPVDPGMPGLRARMGYLPQEPAFHPWMTGEEVLMLTGALHGFARREARRRVGELLERLDLAAAARRRVGGWSSGMRQRLGIAGALFASPDLLLLDEPVAALDPLGRTAVLALLKDLGRCSTVFLSSHVLADLERTCDHVTILHQGRILASEPLASLEGRFFQPVFEVEAGGDPEALRAGLAALPSVDLVEDAGPGATGTERVRIWARNRDAAGQEVPALVARLGVPLRRFAAVEPTLEEVFVRMVDGGTP
ncbi:MAG: ABC transporter ATP-binding protein [Deltaproteobacteria bacterium]|nr:ABC transporter ATP-binding protein [Deltaproteobacteria bacterium]